MDEGAEDVAFDVDRDVAGDDPPADPRRAAEVYIDLARAVIAAEFTADSGLTRWDVRTWWRDEGEHRKLYKLTRAQEGELTDLCRIACEPLPEGAQNPAEWADDPDKPKTGARASRARKRSPV